VTLSGSSVVKGLVMMAMGLLLANVGLDPISGKTRFAFGVTELQSGFDFVTLAMGIFGLGEIFYGLETAMRSGAVTTKVGQVWPTMADWVASRMAILRGTLIGFFIGVIPGGGAVISSSLPTPSRRRCRSTRAVRPRRHRGRGRPRIGQQRRVELVLHPASHARHPGQRLDRHDLRGGC